MKHLFWGSCRCQGYILVLDHLGYANFSYIYK